MEKYSFGELIHTHLESICDHCKQRCVTVKLDENIHNQIDLHGVESLQEVDQAVYEGLLICTECYEKEGGIS